MNLAMKEQDEVLVKAESKAKEGIFYPEGESSQDGEDMDVENEEYRDAAISKAVEEQCLEYRTQLEAEYVKQ